MRRLSVSKILRFLVCVCLVSNLTSCFILELDKNQNDFITRPWESDVGKYLEDSNDNED